MKKLMFTIEDLENAYNTGVYQSNINNLNTYDNFEDYFANGCSINHLKEYFEKEDVLKILIKLYNDKNWSSINENDIEQFLEEYILENSPKVEEERVPVTYFQIKNSCGWSRWCDVTGGNHYVINEWGEFTLETIFYCTKSQYEKLF